MLITVMMLNIFYANHVYLLSHQQTQEQFLSFSCQLTELQSISGAEHYILDGPSNA